MEKKPVKIIGRVTISRKLMDKLRKLGRVGGLVGNRNKKAASAMRAWAPGGKRRARESKKQKPAGFLCPCKRFYHFTDDIKQHWTQFYYLNCPCGRRLRIRGGKIFVNLRRWNKDALPTATK